MIKISDLDTGCYFKLILLVRFSWFFEHFLTFCLQQILPDSSCGFSAPSSSWAISLRSSSSFYWVMVVFRDQDLSPGYAHCYGLFLLIGSFWSRTKKCCVYMCTCTYTCTQICLHIYMTYIHILIPIKSIKFILILLILVYHNKVVFPNHICNSVALCIFVFSFVNRLIHSFLEAYNAQKVASNWQMIPLCKASLLGL